MLSSSLRRAFTPVLSSRPGLASTQTARFDLHTRLAPQLSRCLTASAKWHAGSDLASIIQPAPRRPSTSVDSQMSSSYDDEHTSVWGHERILSGVFKTKKSPEERWREMSAKVMRAPHNAKDAYAGRSIEVKRNDTVANAYRKLSTIITRNNVRKELRMAERHEKKGPKRRRLSSERWRRRFAHEVRKKVQLVQAIRTRGG